MSKPTHPRLPRKDPRFVLHPRQPRADKLGADQRRLCQADPAFREALASRVSNEQRFSAFLDGAAWYTDLERPCSKCRTARKRTRDRSCYTCHLQRGGANFERMKAGLAPVKERSLTSYLDLLERKRAERSGECETRTFGNLTVTRWPTGRLEVHFPDGYVEPDLSKQDGRHVHRLMEMLPELRDALAWAGWS